MTFCRILRTNFPAFSEKKKTEFPSVKGTLIFRQQKRKTEFPSASFSCRSLFGNGNEEAGNRKRKEKRKQPYETPCGCFFSYCFILQLLLRALSFYRLCLLPFYGTQGWQDSLRFTFLLTVFLQYTGLAGYFLVDIFALYFKYLFFSVRNNAVIFQSKKGNRNGGVEFGMYKSGAV